MNDSLNGKNGKVKVMYVRSEDKQDDQKKSDRRGGGDQIAATVTAAARAGIAMNAAIAENAVTVVIAANAEVREVIPMTVVHRGKPYPVSRQKTERG